MRNLDRYKDEDRTGRTFDCWGLKLHEYAVMFMPGVQGASKVKLWWSKDHDLEVRPTSGSMTFYSIVNGTTITADGVPRRFFSKEDAVVMAIPRIRRAGADVDEALRRLKKRIVDIEPEDWGDPDMLSAQNEQMRQARMLVEEIEELLGRA